MAAPKGVPTGANIDVYALYKSADLAAYDGVATSEAKTVDGSDDISSHTHVAGNLIQTSAHVGTMTSVGALRTTGNQASYGVLGEDAQRNAAAQSSRDAASFTFALDDADAVISDMEDLPTGARVLLGIRNRKGLKQHGTGAATVRIVDGELLSAGIDGITPDGITNYTVELALTTKIVRVTAAD